jgi:hypothetical protein
MFNGKQVPSGTWCLPQGKDNLGCGQYTGRATWSFNTATGVQEWVCECLYKNLYGGKECLTQRVCIDPTIGEDQSHNKLADKDGNVWDPLSKDFVPGDNPYEKNPDGSAKYTCQCDQNKNQDGQTKFTKLTGEPYKCFADPCDAKHKTTFFDQDKQQCVCPDDPTESTISFAHSNVTGQCLNITSDCPGVWSKETNACQCDEQSVTRTCKTKTFTRESYTDGDTECDSLAGGSYCKHPCIPNQCQNGGSCLTVGDSYECSCPGGGSDGHEYCSQVCNYGTSQFSGKNCEKSCIIDGTSIDPYADKSACCSNNINYTYIDGVATDPVCGPPPPPCTIL